MNITHFFEHWKIAENPFRGEEARHDGVLARMAFASAGLRLDRKPAPGTARGSVHSDFEKILGEFMRPSTSIVFGEKGSGKTTIRLQIEDRVALHNQQRPADKLFLIAYDDLNPFIGELHERFSDPKDPLLPFKKFRLVDHMDALLSIAAGSISTALLGEDGAGPAGGIGDELHAGNPTEMAREVRKLPLALRRDLHTLLALYDTADVDGGRAAALRRLLRLGPVKGETPRRLLAALGWIPAVGTLVALLVARATLTETAQMVLGSLTGVLAALYLAVLAKVWGLDRLALRSRARRLHQEMRAMPRGVAALGAALAGMDPGLRTPESLPMSPDADAPRYAMMERLRRVLARFGYTGTLVLMDRVDEPTLVNGDAEKMRELVWPLLNNKFLQQDRTGFKMLLPLELRHALFRESAAFFQEARLDKQSLVERLTWTGPMLYDLCNARLAACVADGAAPVALIDLFAEDVKRTDLVDALEAMAQPRDAFKFLYRCLNDHCANVTADENAWRVPKLVLDQVRRQEAERVQQLQRGIRPA